MKTQRKMKIEMIDGKTMWCRLWELAEERGFQIYAFVYKGKVNGAYQLYHDNEPVATFAVLKERGIYQTFAQKVRLIEGNWDFEQ